VLSGDVKLQIMGAQSAGVLYRQCYIGGGAGGGEARGTTAQAPMTGLGHHALCPPPTLTPVDRNKAYGFGKTLLRVTKFDGAFLENV